MDEAIMAFIIITIDKGLLKYNAKTGMYERFDVV